MGDALRWLTRAEHFVLVHVENDYETSLLREDFNTCRNNTALSMSCINAALQNNMDSLA